MMNKHWWLVISLLLVVFVNPLFGQLDVDFVHALAWSSDGKYIAISFGAYRCSDAPRSVLIVDAISKSTVQSISTGRCTVESLDWNSDSIRLAGVSADSVSFHVWDATTGQIVAEQKGGSQGAKVVRWKPKSDQLMTTNISNSATLFDGITGEKIGLIGSATTIDWNADGSRFVTGSYYYNGINIIDATTNNVEMELSQETLVYVVDWSSDDTKIAALHSDNTIKIWDANTGKLLNSFDVQNPTSLQWSPNSQNIAVGTSDGEVLIYDVVTGNLVTKYSKYGSVNAVAWSPDGTQLAFGGAGNNGEIEIVEPFVMQSTDNNDEPEYIGKVAQSWNPEGTILAFGGRQLNSTPIAEGIWLFDTLTQETRLLVNDNPLNLVWSHDGTKIAYVLSIKGRPRYTIIDSANGNILGVFDTFNTDRYRIYWSDNNQEIAILDVVIRIYSTEGVEFNSIGEHNDNINDFTWSENSERFYTIGKANSVVLTMWDAQSGEVIKRVNLAEPVNSLAVSPDGTKLALGAEDSSILVVNAVSLEVLASLSQGLAREVRHLMWHPDNIHIVSADYNNVLRVWNTKVMTLVEELRINNEVSFYSVTWRPHSNDLTYSKLSSGIPIIDTIEAITAFQRLLPTFIPGQ